MVVVSVNEEAITQEMVEAQVQRETQALLAQGRISPQQLQGVLPQVRERAIDQLIVKTLLAGEVKAKEVSPGAEAIAAGVSKVAAGLPDGVSLEQALARQKMTQAELEAMIGEDLAIERLLELSLPEQPEPSDADVTAFFEANKERMGQQATVHARHILFSKDGEAPEATAKAVQKKLADGGDFAAAAKEHSSCPSGQKGGDLGTFGRGQMVPEFEHAAFSQEIDAVGDVVKTQFGYHVIQVLERTEAVAPSLEDVRDKIVDQLETQQRGKAFTQYVEELRGRATIERPEN